MDQHPHTWQQAYKRPIYPTTQERETQTKFPKVTDRLLSSDPSATFAQDLEEKTFNNTNEVLQYLQEQVKLIIPPPNESGIKESSLNF